MNFHMVHEQRKQNHSCYASGIILVLMTLVGVCSAQETEVVTTTSSQESVVRSKSQSALRVAVADLAYEQKVSEFFYQYNRSTNTSNNNFAKNDTDGHKSGFDNQFSNTETESAGTIVRMERAELRKFTSDIKGELIKSGQFRVTQAKPWLQNESPTVFDVIERIKGGYFPNADLVLFGVINNVDFRVEANHIQGSSSQSRGLYLEMVVEFSLIDTRTNEVVASFTASGEGQEVRLGSAGDTAGFNRVKVIQEASQDLGRNVAKEILVQYQR